MRIILFLTLGSLILIAVVLFWPPAVVHISHTTPFFRDIYVSISDLRAAIFVFAVVTFIATVVSALISAVRHRA